MKRQISNVIFEQQKSSVNGYKEFKVSFVLNKKKEAYFTFVKEGKDVNYLAEAKKSFYRDLKSGQVSKVVNKSHFRSRPALITATSVLGAIAIASTSLLVWKLLSNNNPVVPPDPPTDVEYINNFTKERTYRIDDEDDRILTNESTREYNENWQVIKEIRTKYNPNTHKISGIDTITTEYDEKYRVINKYQESATGQGIVRSVHSIATKYDEQDRVVEEIVVNANGPISSATKIETNKKTINFVDDDNYDIREETHDNDILTREEDTECRSSISDNEKTSTAISHSITYSDDGYTVIEEKDKQDVLLLKYDSLNRVSYSQQKSIVNTKEDEETTSSTDEDTISYVYDFDDSLSCEFEEHTKKIDIGTEGEEYKLETFKKGHREVFDSYVEELYQVTDERHPIVPVDTYYTKDTIFYDDLNREISRKVYVDVGFNSLNTEHAWIPFKYVLTSYIGATDKILSEFKFDANYLAGSPAYKFVDSIKKVDKYNRWITDARNTYNMGSQSGTELLCVEREYAEPVPVNPDIPQPEEE